ncbi:hypothetical protein AVEN_227884-1, partial [Araneus ventricosus]
PPVTKITTTEISSTTRNNRMSTPPTKSTARPSSKATSSTSSSTTPSSTTGASSGMFSLLSFYGMQACVMVIILKCLSKCENFMIENARRTLLKLEKKL